MFCFNNYSYLLLTKVYMEKGYNEDQTMIRRSRRFGFLYYFKTPVPYIICQVRIA
jgi:hypothetical protein